MVSAVGFRISSLRRVIRVKSLSLGHSANHTTSSGVDHSVTKMYHNTLNYLQKIPLTNLIENQILNFSLNPWDHLSPSEDWKCSDSGEENSVSSDKFSVQSPVSPGNLSPCNNCDSIVLNTSELRLEKESCQLTQELDVALLRIKTLEDKQDEMLRIHASMTALISGLVKVVSTCISGQTVHRSSQSAPHEPRMSTEPEVNTGSSFQSPSSPPYKAAIERKEDDWKESRKKQQLQIDKLVDYIDERAAYYIKNRPTERPYPRVDWTKVNIHTKRNLPQPSKLPVHGCPQDPLIYPDAPKPEGRIMEYYNVTSKCSIPGCEHKPCIPPPGCNTTIHTDKYGTEGSITAISTSEEKNVLLQKVYRPLRAASSPFGTAPGFPTNLGVVSMPTSPVGGYLYTEDEGWVLYATPR